MNMIRLCMVSALLLGGMGYESLYAGEKWQGIDETVVKRFAREHGRGEHPPLVPAPEGDLQLFMFLTAGTVGGFVAGYYWRVLLEGKNKRSQENLKG
jgi:hypothetical protein